MSSDDTKVGQAPRPAAGPLAGTPYDFRNLYPDLIERTEASAADQGVRPTSSTNVTAATTRRGMFDIFRRGKANP